MKISERNGMLDIMKSFLIIIVLITHFSWTTDERQNPIFPFVIDMAIPAFMIITGYVYMLSMERKGINSLSEAYSAKEILPRILRYTIPFVIVVFWQMFDPNVSMPEDGLEKIRWFLNGTSGPGSYYYPVMIQIVFLFPLLYCMIERRGGVLVCG